MFWFRGELSRPAQQALETAEAAGRGVYVSPITAWELGLLVSRGRLILTVSPLAWFERLLNIGVRLADLSPEVLVESSFLPGPRLRDPADKIIAATARAHDLRLMTRDRPLLEWAQAGHALSIAC